jgi:large subunit ribosomal protein L15
VAGVITTVRKKAPTVKILGTGEITKKINVENCQVSASAKAKIEKAGGSVK